MAGIFGEFFLVSVSHETKHEKSSKKIGENSEQNSGQNSGRKSEKFGKLSFCSFSDLTISEKPLDGRLWLGHPAGVPAQMLVLLYSKQPQIPGTLGGRPLFVPPGVRGHPAGVPRIFLIFICLYLSWTLAVLTLVPGQRGRKHKVQTGWLRNRTGTGNRNRRNRNRRNSFPGTESGTGTVLSFKNVLKHRRNLFVEEPPEPKTGTDRTFPPPNRNRTEPNRGQPVQSASVFSYMSRSIITTGRWNPLLAGRLREFTRTLLPVRSVNFRLSFCELSVNFLLSFCELSVSFLLRSVNFQKRTAKRGRPNICHKLS